MLGDEGEFVKLRVFFAGTGDALLLSAGQGKNVLVDGGPSSGIFDSHILPSLRGLHNADEKLDLVVITHIDDDHIDGILRLLHLYEQASGRGVPAGHPMDLPTITALWHNSWKEISPGVLATRIPPPGPGAAIRPASLGFAFAPSNVCYSPYQGGEVVVMTDTELRSIKRNSGFRDGLVALTSPLHKAHLGAELVLTVLGPGRTALDNLKVLFERDAAKHARTAHGRIADWLSAARAKLNLVRPMRKRSVTRRNAAQLAQQLRADTNILRHLDIAHPHGATPDPAVETNERLGEASKVTPANRASIIVLAAENGNGNRPRRTCLLTGDAAVPDIVDGLIAAGKLQPGSVFRCDILKVQHHGAEFNFDETFARQVIARHYAFSANGQYRNPDPEVVRVLITERAAVAKEEPFCVWFTCSAERAPTEHQPEMRAALDAAVASAQKANSGTPKLVTVRVMKDTQDFFDICLCSDPAGGCGCIPADEATTVLAS
jgi:hypothetical protein